MFKDFFIKQQKKKELSSDEQLKIRSLFSNQYEVIQTISSAFDMLIGAIGSFSKNSETIKSTNQNFTKKFEEQRRLIKEVELKANSIQELQATFESNLQLTFKIIEHLKVIDDIVLQTNILSLNASIEAARAGENGKAFGVVAQSVCDLANSSLKAASDIRSILEKLDTSSKNMKDIFTIFQNQLKQQSSELRTNTEQLFQESDQLQGVMKQISVDCDASTNTASESQKRVKDDLEKLTKMTSDLIGSLTGNTIVDLRGADIVEKLQDFEIIDVRKDSEFNGDLSHIEGAQLITLGTELDEYLKTADKDKTYLFVCRSGGRSSRAARLAQSYGLPKIFNLNGGMLNWNSEKLPTAARSAGPQLL